VPGVLARAGPLPPGRRRRHGCGIRGWVVPWALLHPFRGNTELAMNRIYSKVWNKSLGMLVVASEFARARGKGSAGRSLRRRLAAAMVAAGGLCAGGHALAEDRGIGATVADGVVEVIRAKEARGEPGTDGSYADGGASTAGRDATAIGNGASADADAASAFGAHARAARISASAFGHNANAQGTNSTALGANAQALDAVTTAIGSNAQARANAATALGYDSRVLEAATNGVALGARSIVSAANSVALGAGSMADRENTVSVGREGAERQITHVAAGTLATDAVNKSQLDAVADGVSEAQHYFKASGRQDGSDDAMA